MSGNSEQGAEVQEETIQPLSHRRIFAVMAALIVVSVALSAVFISANFGLGVLIGGILSLVNYYWLKQSLKRIFDKAVAGVVTKFLATRYFFRYLIFGAVLAIVYLTKTVPVEAVLLGLASFAFAIMIEAFIRLFSSLFKKGNI
ncbi:MAG: ATP synthase subunit I [Acidobacteriota bacterium]|nr:ATP synthase subunit I [Acidobacteriota bacterium]